MAAAWFLYASTREMIDSAIHKKPDGQEAFRLMEWTENVMKTAAAASHLNGVAAIWTAVAVVAGALSTVFSALGAN